MDMLDQHLEQQEVSNVITKQEHNNTDIIIEETEVVDGDGDGVVDEELHYQEPLAYRVVQVSGSPGNEIENMTQTPLQVLTSPINGQFYVIGNANDVFTTAQTTRSVIAPRATATLQIESPPATASTGLKKRDDRRRATHNEVERRRRDKINNWITKLGKIIPDCNTTNGNANNGESGGKTNYETQSKGGILAKACEYIAELRAANQSMGQCLRDNEKLKQEVAALKQLVGQLRRENLHLKSQLPSAQETTDVHILS